MSAQPGRSLEPGFLGDGTLPRPSRHVLVVSTSGVPHDALRDLLGEPAGTVLAVDHIEDLDHVPMVLAEGVHDVLVLAGRLDPQAIGRLVTAASRAENHPPIVVLPADSDPGATGARGAGSQGLPVRPPKDLVEEVFRHALETTSTRRALRASEGRFTLLVQASAQGVVVVDREGIVRSLNPAAERLLACRAAERVGFEAHRALPELRRIDDRPFDDDTHPLRLARWRTWSFVETPVRVRRPDGTDAELMLRAQRMPGADAGTGRALLLLLSPLASSTGAARPPSTGGAAPAATAAHDLINMLYTIQGYAELLAAGVASHDPSRAHLESIHDAVERATRLLRPLRAPLPAPLLAPVSLDVDAFLGGKRPLLEQLLGPQVHLDLELALGGMRVQADPAGLEQAIMNLAINARDALERGGHVRIATAPVALGRTEARALTGARPGSFARVTVEDDGCGMDTDTRRRAFEPFFTTKAQHRGSGLGLVTVRGFIERSRGFLTLDSAPGTGTRLDLYLPREDGH